MEPDTRRNKARWSVRSHRGETGPSLSSFQSSSRVNPGRTGRARDTKRAAQAPSHGRCADAAGCGGTDWDLGRDTSVSRNGLRTVEARHRGSRFDIDRFQLKPRFSIENHALEPSLDGVNRPPMITKSRQGGGIQLRKNEVDFGPRTAFSFNVLLER